jgi:hypothetical protein
MKKIKELLLAFNIFMFNTYSVFATGNTLTVNDLNQATGFRWVFNRFMGLVVAAGTVAFSVCIIRYIVADNEQAAARAKANAREVIVAWIAAIFLELIISAFFTFIGDVEI